MGAACHQHCQPQGTVGTRFRRALIAVLAINATMFVVELAAGLAAGSKALQADSLDFLADTGTYALSLAVLGLSLRWRARAAMAKGVSMAALGLWILVTAIVAAFAPGAPDAPTMGVVGIVALVANLVSVLLLLRYREGDANIRSVWLCSRNDAIGNLLVVAAAVGVFGTGTAWPDLGVALLMSTLFLSGAWQVIGQALTELRAAHRDDPLHA